MANVYDAAEYILSRLGRMSTWKLQKLCYYAQAWHLAWTERPLFDEDFEAWRNGPVCRELYNQHRGKFMVESIPKGDANALDDDERDSVDRVLAEYGVLEPYELREQTHREDPWIAARGGVSPESASCSVISKSSIGEYYASL